MADKVFESASVLTIFVREDSLGWFQAQTVKRKQLTIDNHGEDAFDTHEVVAITEVDWIEKRNLAIVKRWVSCDGRYRLPKSHPYRESDRWSTKGAYKSGDLMTDLVAIADAWRDECRRHMPDKLVKQGQAVVTRDGGKYAFTDDEREEVVEVSIGPDLETAIEQVADAINAGALGEGVTASVERASQAGKPSRRAKGKKA